MAQCVAVAASGVLTVSEADPCTSLVVLTPSEYAHMSNNPLALDAEDGFTVAVGIIGVWVSAYCVRAAIKALNGADNGSYYE